MSFENLKAGRDSLNVTIPQGEDVVKQIIAAGLDKGKPVALFANPSNSSGGALMIPLNSTQNNGTAPWVDNSQDLTTMGVPLTERIYLQVWVEAHGTYYMVGGIIHSLKYESISEALA